MWIKGAVISVMTLLVTASEVSAQTAADQPFRFEAHPDVDDMHAYIKGHLPLGAPRNLARQVFVGQGEANLVIRPDNTSDEKYVYDIDMCHYYLFRWNISIDYDQNGRLTQAYVQGEPVYAEAENDSAPHPTDPNLKVKIYKLELARPQAYKGDDYIYASVIDWNPGKPHNYNKDVFVGGPTRAGIPNMGRIHVYHSKLWRSIVDDTITKKVAEYATDCNVLDAQAAGRRPPNVSLMVYNTLSKVGERALTSSPQP